jgi:hypothetical protein
MTYFDSEKPPNEFAVSSLASGASPRLASTLNDVYRSARFLNNTRRGALPCDDGAGTRSLDSPQAAQSGLNSARGGPDSGATFEGFVRLHAGSPADASRIIIAPAAYPGALPAQMTMDLFNRFIRIRVWGVTGATAGNVGDVYPGGVGDIDLNGSCDAGGIYGATGGAFFGEAGNFFDRSGNASMSIAFAAGVLVFTLDGAGRLRVLYESAVAPWGAFYLAVDVGPAYF